MGGQSLERIKMRNQMKEDNWFHPEDFYVGAQVVMNGFHFDSAETDQQTMNIMADNTEVFAPEQILKALADK